jgi:hypothetical protein
MRERTLTRERERETETQTDREFLGAGCVGKGGSNLYGLCEIM